MLVAIAVPPSALRAASAKLAFRALVHGGGGAGHSVRFRVFVHVLPFREPIALHAHLLQPLVLLQPCPS